MQQLVKVKHNKILQSQFDALNGVYNPNEYYLVASDTDPESYTLYMSNNTGTSVRASRAEQNYTDEEW